MQLCNYEVGINSPFFVIAGPCVIESEALCLDIAQQMKEVCDALGIHYIFKASFDKANRTSANSFRGPGIDRGLKILDSVRAKTALPILTDVHTREQVDIVKDVVDVLQTPAFLCRQTDFIRACAQSGKPVNIKKGQFLSPYDMKYVIAKARQAAQEVGLDADCIMACERGTTFGYGNLVVDMRSLGIMRQDNTPVVFDATHSVQLPGGNGTSSSGQRQFVPLLARAAAAVGVAGFFFETHPDPSKAKSDGPNMLPLSMMKSLLSQLQEIDQVAKSKTLMEHTF